MKHSNLYNKEDLKDHTGVAAVITNDRGELLILDHVKFNSWTLPMGKVRESETDVDALHNEIFEEVGLTILSEEYITELRKTYNVLGKDVLIDLKLYKVNSYTGQPINKEPNKHRSMKWVKEDEVMKLEPISDALALYKEYLKNNN